MLLRNMVKFPSIFRRHISEDAKLCCNAIFMYDPGFEPWPRCGPAVFMLYAYRLSELLQECLQDVNCSFQRLACSSLSSVTCLVTPGAELFFRS
jgi:hypothetical protein